MRFQLGIQAILLITAAVIAFTVIKPKFADIRSDQNEVVAYRDALLNIGKYNQRLQTLINQYNSMPASDRAALFRYLPEDIDTAVISRDIANIVSRNRLLLLDVTFDPVVPVTTVAPDGSTVGADQLVDQNSNAAGLMAQRFKLDVVGTYSQMKSMLQDFERNNYPLRIVELGFTLEDTTTDLVQYSLILETYSLPPHSRSNI